MAKSVPFDVTQPFKDSAGRLMLGAIGASGRRGWQLMSASTAKLLEQSHRIGVQFLLADLATALTFLDVSEVTGLEESRLRNLQNARHVYDTVIRLMPKVAPSHGERAVLEDRLAELKRRLIATGESIDPENQEVPES